MSRIRTIKPEFFRHELLQDLQSGNPSLNPMLVFAGLWTLCDKAGRFEWKPRQIKLDILPFLDFSMVETLALLTQAGMVIHYEVEGKHLGLIPTFQDHQRITGKEAQSPERYPGPDQGNIREAPGCVTDVQEREREREREVLTTVSLSAPQSAKADTAAKTTKRISKRAKQLQIAELSMTADQAGAWDRIKTAWPRKGWNSQTRSEQPRFTNPARAGAWFKEICNDAPIELSEGQRITPADLADATIAWLQKRWKETARGGSPVVPCIENFFSCDPASKLHWQSALLEHFGVSEAS